MKPYGSKHPHGTSARYQYHLIHGETPCELCREAARQQARARYKRKTPRQSSPKRRDVNRSIVRAFKFAAGSCMDCGLIVDDKTIVCFDMDHRDPSNKSFTIARMMGKAETNDLLDELRKCDVVCRNCHALRTHAKNHHLFRKEHIVDRPSLFDVI